MEFHQHIAISALAPLEEMSYVKYYLRHLFVSAYIGMQNMREGQEVFPGMSRVTVENVLPADLVFHSVSAPLQYTCCSWQETLAFLLRWLLHQHLCLGRRSSALDHSIGLGLLLLTVRTVSVLIYDPEPRRYIISSAASSQMLQLLIFPLPCATVGSVTGLQ